MPLSVIYMSLALVAQQLLGVGERPMAPTQATTPAARVARLPSPGGAAGVNPFGLLLGARDLDARARVALARRLGAQYWRPVSAVAADHPNAPCPECDAAHDAGLRLVLSIRANGGGVLHPTTPPQDLEAYARGVAQLLDRHRPVLLVVENEENSDLFYRGSPAEYLTQLRSACAIAHARGIPCTNGGLVSSLVVALAAEHYREHWERKRADAYLRRTLGEAASAMLQTAKGRAQLARGKALMAGYRTAGADYVNFHWYVRDPSTLADALAYLRSVTGLEPITNEVGQTGADDPALVTGVMRSILDAGLPLAVWFSIDTAPSRARALTDERGALRSTGEAFQRVTASLSRQ